MVLKFNSIKKFHGGHHFSIKYFFLFIFLIILNSNSNAQEDFGWWVEKHNWDGVSPWHHYMTLSTSYFGPNALMVPEVENGRIDSNASLKISYDYYYSKGDQTQDFFLKAVLPLFNNRMSVGLSVVPLEFYKMDTITRDIRAARTRSGEGSAGGDIYINTLFQIIKEKRSLPDIVLRMSFRTASGTHLRDARYTDAPGYYTDLSFGKTILNNSSYNLRIYADAGLYVYQTYYLRNLQNDCIYYGGGVALNTSSISWMNHLAGYYGYMNIGDRPLVYTSELRLLQKMFDWSWSYQWGINDFAYQRFSVSVIFHIPSEKIFSEK